MDIIKTTVHAVTRRPFILLMVAALMLAAVVLNAFVPVLAILIGVVKMTSGGVLESLLSLLQMLIDPGVLPALLIFLGVTTLLVSLLSGLLLPGYLAVVDDTLAKAEHKRKTKSIFLEGMKSNFFKFFFMTIKTMVMAVLLTIFLIVASVPAIIATRAALTTKPNLMVGALFIDFVTAGVLFMSSSFFQSYVYMWYMAASKGEKKPFKAGKAVADRRFWSLVLNLFLFGLVFAIIIYIIYLSDNRALRYIAGWAFATAFYTTLAVYLVKTYKDGSILPENN